MPGHYYAKVHGDAASTVIALKADRQRALGEVRASHLNVATKRKYEQVQAPMSQLPD